MRDVIKLRDDAMPMVWASEAMCVMNLWAKVPEDDDSRLIRPIEQRANEKLKVFHALLVPKEKEVNKRMHAVQASRTPDRRHRTPLSRRQCSRAHDVHYRTQSTPNSSAA